MMKFKNYHELIDKYPGLFEDKNVPLKIIRNQSRILDWQKHRRVLLSEKGLPLEWADIGVLLEDQYIIVLRDLVEFPDGNQSGYTRMIPRADLYGSVGVIVLPMYKNKVLLLNHFRHSTRKWHLEIPRGNGEPDLSSAENAQKELEEEVGAKTSKLISLGSLYPETGFESQRVELFLAKIASVGLPEINEGIESIVWLTIHDLEEWIANEKITDGFTIAAYTKAKLKGLI
jgi:ADP-ribose pyrophosphatase